MLDGGLHNETILESWIWLLYYLPYSCVNLYHSHTTIELKMFLLSSNSFESNSKLVNKNVLKKTIWKDYSLKLILCYITYVKETNKYKTYLCGCLCNLLGNYSRFSHWSIALTYGLHFCHEGTWHLQVFVEYSCKTPVHLMDQIWQEVEQWNLLLHIA